MEKERKFGFKATYNGKCLDKTYEIGKTYEMIGELSSDDKSFDYSDDILDVFTFYDIENKDIKHIKVFKVEILGDFIDSNKSSNRSVTNKLKVIEEVAITNIKKMLLRYDKRDNIICEFIPFKDEYEYDNNGNIIKVFSKFKYGDGEPSRVKNEFKYDKKNRVIYESNDYNHIYNRYDEKTGNLLHTRVLSKSNHSLSYNIIYDYTDNYLTTKTIIYESYVDYNRNLSQKIEVSKFTYDENDNIIKNDNILTIKNIPQSDIFQYILSESIEHVKYNSVNKTETKTWEYKIY